MGKREEYLKNIKAQLDEWKADIDKLEARLKKTTSEVRIELKERIKDLRNQRDVVKQKLNEYQKSSIDAGGDIKEGLENAWKNLKESIEKAKSRYQ